MVGPCPYNNNINTYHNDNTFVSLPSNVTELNRIMCGGIGRTGQFCGQCMEGHSPPVYSYYPQCVNCTAGTNNFAKYLAVSLLPTTVFFIGALVFRFRATSPLLKWIHLVLPDSDLAPDTEVASIYIETTNNIMRLMRFIF